MADLEFDAESHTYRIGGRVIPGVTQILEPLQYMAGVPWAVLEAAREFGTNVHSACDLWNKGMLDTDCLDPHLKPYLAGWIAFLNESGFVVTSSEQRIYNSHVGYAGTADVFGTWQRTTWCIDVKSGAVPWTVGYQLAAYQQAAKERPRRRLCVQLVGNGDYKLHEQKNLGDFHVFVSALNIFNARMRNCPRRAHEEMYAGA